MNKLIGFSFAIIIALTIVAVQADPGSDIDGSGATNAVDIGIVKSKFGQVSIKNPCIEFKVFDDNVQPTYLIVNSLDEVITPRGGYWLYPAEHPAREAIRAGTPIPPRACP